MHIIPRTPSPLPLTEREPDELSREELLALVAQQKQSLADKEMVTEPEGFYFPQRALFRAEETDGPISNRSFKSPSSRSPPLRITPS
jgi:hypothetical protein